MAPNPLLGSVGERWAAFPWEHRDALCEVPAESSAEGYGGGTCCSQCVSPRRVFHPLLLLPGKGWVYIEQLGGQS